MLCTLLQRFCADVVPTKGLQKSVSNQFYERNVPPEPPTKRAVKECHLHLLKE